MPATKARILLVEDEEGLVMTIGDRLRSEGYEFDSAGDGTAGLDRARSSSFDLILLDVMLPGKNGYELCRELRAAGVPTPVLMLTARSLVTDRVHGLKLGADDYLCKPFEMSELVARVEALLRRSSIAKKNEGSEDPAALGRVEYKDFALDFAKGLVIRDGTETPLSAQEYKLLAWLAAHPGEILSRERLLEAVWGYGNAVTTRTVDVHVAWLRQKLGDSGPAPRHILTIRGLGYRFMP